jgi:GNAT superfamily N-acetyltransferase
MTIEVPKTLWPAIKQAVPPSSVFNGITLHRSTARQSPADCLAYRRSGRLVGALLYTYDGEFTVVVAPGFRRQGIATELVRSALRFWPAIDLNRQRWTPVGKKLRKSLE